MYPSEQAHVKRVLQLADECTDFRWVTKDELVSLLLFVVYGQQCLSQIDRELRGWTLRQSGVSCLLVVKTTLNEVPHVVFTTARNPTDCIRVFIRKLYADTCEWVPDKYA